MDGYGVDDIFSASGEKLIDPVLGLASRMIGIGRENPRGGGCRLDDIVNVFDDPSMVGWGPDPPRDIGFVHCLEPDGKSGIGLQARIDPREIVGPVRLRHFLIEGFYGAVPPFGDGENVLPSTLLIRSVTGGVGQVPTEGATVTQTRQGVDFIQTGAGWAMAQVLQ